MSDESKSALAVACTLSTAAMRERRQQVLAPLWETIEEVKVVAEGLALRFAPERASLAALGELLELERRCCPFLRFDLAVEAGGGPIWLALTGPPGTRQFLASELGLPAGFGPEVGR